MSVAWFDNVTLTVEAALSAATGSYAVWDVSTFNGYEFGPDIIYTDITEYVLGISVSRRFGREVQVWESGRLTLTLDDADGRFDPSNLSGPYVTGGVTGIRPWRPVRVRAAYNGVTYNIYSGYALAWQESYVKGAAVAQVDVAGVDELGRLAGFDGLEQPSVGGGETSGKRIHRILNNAGHAGERSIDEGRITVLPTTLSSNAVSEMQLTAESEGGAVFIDASGAVVFQHQYALIENTRSNTIQATFGDSAGELPYFDIDTAYDGDLLANIAVFGRTGGATQTASDNTSRALYGDRRYVQTNLVCETDSQVLGRAELHLANV